MKKYFIPAVIIAFVPFLTIAQKVIISSPSDKTINWDSPGATTVHTIGFTIINSDPGKIKSVNCIPDYAASSIKSPTISFGSPALPVPPGSLTGSINITIQTPAKIPKEEQQIILRFPYVYNDTVYFNYDTLIIKENKPVIPKFFKKEKTLRWIKDTSNIFRSEITQFTDFNGFDNQKPNGLLQEELVLKFPLAKNRRHLDSTEGHKDTYYQYFRSVVFTGLFNRIDKTKSLQEYPIGATLPYNPNNKDSIQNYLTTMDIFKYSNLQLGINFNVLTFHTGKFRINFDYEFGVLRNKPYFADTVRILDTFFAKNELRNIYSFVHKFEFYANNSQLIGKDFGASFNGGIMLIRLKDSYYKQFDATSVDAFDRIAGLLPANENRTARPIWFFTGTFKKLWGENNKSVTFLRISYNYQTGKYTTYTGDPKLTNGNFDPAKFRPAKFYNHFLQLQLGVTLDINKILESKK
jgi:hypothetical protein